MLRIRNILSFVAASLLVARAAEAKLNVVATLPDFGDIARQIGGDTVAVTVLAKPTEDAHFVVAKPSYIRVLNQAELLIESGADLEIGWLPALVDNARNPRILSGAPGNLRLAGAVEILEVPTGGIDRSMGDVHPNGNPHFWLDPENGRRIATAVAEALARLDPSHAVLFQANARKFDTEVTRKLETWSAAMAPFKGTKVVTYHKSYDYLLRRFGLVLAGTIEPKPGIEPSPTHIGVLQTRMKDEKVRLIVMETFRPRKTAEQLAKATGATLILLPDKVGGSDQAGDYFALFDSDIAQLVKVLESMK